MVKKQKKAKSVKSILTNKLHLSSVKILFLKFLIAFICIVMFYLIVYEAYNYVLKPVNIDSIPLAKFKNHDYKQKPNSKDGTIFSNQNKMIYNTISKSKNNKRKKNIKEQVSKEYSHDEIFKILDKVNSSKNNQKKDKEVKNSKQKNETIIKKTKQSVKKNSTIKPRNTNKQTQLKNNPFSVIDK